MDSIKVMVVDDQSLFRTGLVSILSKLNGIQVVGEAENGQVALEKIPELLPDIVLLDLKMPVMDGSKTLARIREDFPWIKVVMLTMYDDDAFIIDLIESGASSYLLKDTNIHELEHTIRMLTENEFFYNSHVQSVIHNMLRNKKDFKSGNFVRELLNSQEMEVLRMVCNEYSNDEIANKLGLAKRTIEGYKRRLLQKTGARNLAGLIVFAVKNGIVE